MNVMRIRWMAIGLETLAAALMNGCAVTGLGVDATVGVVGYDGGYYEPGATTTAAGVVAIVWVLDAGAIEGALIRRIRIGPRPCPGRRRRFRRVRADIKIRTLGTRHCGW